MAHQDSKYLKDFLVPAEELHSIDFNATLEEASEALTATANMEVAVHDDQDTFHSLFTIEDYVTALADEHSLNTKMRDVVPKDDMPRHRIELNSSLDDALSILVDSRRSSLPVVDGPKLVGLIRMRDLVADSFDPVDRADAEVPPAQEPAKKEERQKLLLVEDDYDLQTHLQKILAKYGFDVVLAPSAELAKVEVGLVNFDLVLSDIRLPGISGIDLMIELRRDGHDVPVILMSGFLEAYRTKLDSEGHAARTVLSKPVELDELLESIQTSLAG